MLAFSISVKISINRHHVNDLNLRGVPRGIDGLISYKSMARDVCELSDVRMCVHVCVCACVCARETLGTPLSQFGIICDR